MGRFFFIARRGKIAVVLILTLLFWAGELFPLGSEYLTVEEVEPISRGGFEISVGLRYKDGFRPVGFFEGREEGRLVDAPLLGLRVGLADNVELQVESPLYRHFDPAGSGESVDDFGDLFVWTKIRTLREGPGRPSLAFRLGFKVPSGSDEEGLATDEADLFGQLLLDKAMEKTLLSVNLGLGILGDPNAESQQVDVALMAVGLRFSLSEKSSIGFELSSLFDGTSSVDLTRNILRVGYRFETKGRGVDVAFFGGEDSGEDGFGVALGLIWLFD